MLPKNPYITCAKETIFININHLQLRLSTIQKLSSTTSNAKFARVVNLHLEKDLVTLLPHLSGKSLTWQDWTSEANLDVLDLTVKFVSFFLFKFGHGGDETYPYFLTTCFVAIPKKANP